MSRRTISANSWATLATVMVVAAVCIGSLLPPAVSRGKEATGQAIEVEPVPKGGGFYVRNAKGELLPDAEVTINGEVVGYDAKYHQFRFTKDTPQPYDLVIEHPLYGAWHDPQKYLDSQVVYLLGPSDKFYWQGGVRVPVSYDDKVYFLSLVNEHTLSAEDQAQVDAELFDLLAAFSIEIGHVTMNNKFDDLHVRTITFPAAPSQDDLKKGTPEGTVSRNTPNYQGSPADLIHAVVLELHGFSEQKGANG